MLPEYVHAQSVEESLHSFYLYQNPLFVLTRPVSTNDSFGNCLWNQCLQIVYILPKLHISTRLLYLFFERIQFDYFLWFQIEPIWNHARGTVYDKCQYRNFSFNYIIKFLLCITDSGCFFDWAIPISDNKNIEIWRVDCFFDNFPLIIIGNTEHLHANWKLIHG